MTNALVIGLSKTGNTMAIINSIVIEGKYNRVTSPNPYFWCTHSSDFVLSKSQDEDDPNPAGSVVDTKSDVFGADNYQELINKIETLALIENR